MWQYNSPIGLLTIKYFPEEDMYGLMYEGICWEMCDSPEAEAANVYAHVTGCDDWDRLVGTVPDCPSSLGEWVKI